MAIMKGVDMIFPCDIKGIFADILMKDLLHKEAITREVYFKTSRSSGKGGQHVNKVSTRADAFLDIHNATCFPDEANQISEERRVGKECARKCRYEMWTYH